MKFWSLVLGMGLSFGLVTAALAYSDTTEKPKRRAHKRRACAPSSCSPDKARVEQLEARVQALEALLQKSAADQAARDAQHQKAHDDDQQRVTALAADVDHIKVTQVVQKQNACQLVRPRPRSFTASVDGSFSDISGGESTLWSTRSLTLPLNLSLTNPTVRSQSDDADALTLGLTYTDANQTNWSLSYQNYGVSTGYVGAAGGLDLGSGSLTFLEAGSTVLPPTLLGGVLLPDFLNARAVRTFGTNSWRFRREKTFAESTNDSWSALWGIRRVELDDNLFVAYSEGIGLGGTFTAGAVNVFRTNNLKATGPTVGVRQRHAFGKRWEWQNMAEAGALIGRNNFSLTRTVNPDTASNAFSVNDIAIGYRTNDVFPTLDFNTRLVFHANDQLMVHVGYEVSRIFNAVTNDSYTDSQQKDISIDGIRLGAAYNFN
jgi:hypothetical protein